jgi:glucose-6-phosphate 1-dehydrogenase
MFQNHILQLLTLTAMEAPTTFQADAVRDEKVKVLTALKPLKAKDALSATFRAQYRAGQVNGQKLEGYRQLKGVDPQSRTETLLAAKISIDNWRWAGVPFFIRSGKALPKRVTEIAVQYKQVPLSLFGWKNMAGEAPNMLLIKLQPDEGITLSFGAKVPGPENRIEGVEMNFSYAETFGDQNPEAYERLLMDSMNGDATLFTRSDEVLSAWDYVSQITNAWDNSKKSAIPSYEAGSWGPPEIDAFIQGSGARWRILD